MFWLNLRTADEKLCVPVSGWRIKAATSVLHAKRLDLIVAANWADEKLGRHLQQSTNDNRIRIRIFVSDILDSGIVSQLL